MNEIQQKEFLQKAENYCAHTEHCVSEMVQKLQQWKTPKSQIQLIIDSLLTDKFIDEKRYATAYSRQKFRFDKWGKRKIQMNLSVKRIKDEDIRSALSEIDDKEYATMIQEELKKKARSIKAETAHQFRDKLIRFGISRGYEAELVCEIVPTFNLSWK